MIFNYNLVHKLNSYPSSHVDEQRNKWINLPTWVQSKVKNMRDVIETGTVRRENSSLRHVHDPTWKRNTKNRRGRVVLRSVLRDDTRNYDVFTERRHK